MKTPHFYLKAGLRFILPFAIVTCGTKVLAQTTDSNLIPVVTVQATQPIATATNAGVFTLFRAGNTNATLNVWFDLSGTASNGVDYAAISNHLVEIPAGVTSNTVVITPLAGTSSERGQNGGADADKFAADDARQLRHRLAQQCDDLYRR